MRSPSLVGNGTVAAESGTGTRFLVTTRSPVPAHADRDLGFERGLGETADPENRDPVERPASVNRHSTIGLVAQPRNRVTLAQLDDLVLRPISGSLIA
jgi:hypothetical protein